MPCPDRDAPRPTRARLAAAALWTLFAVMVVAWVLLTWHPWIDWFGRPR